MSSTTNNPANNPANANWQQLFTAMMPAITRHANFAYRRARPDEREELVQEVLCKVCVALATLDVQGKLDKAFPSALAHYAIRQTNEGRRVGASMNSADMLFPGTKAETRTARRENVSFRFFDLLENRHHDNPAEIVQAIVDVTQWLESLPERTRCIAYSLAFGERTTVVAQQFGISSARVSQLRSELYESWNAFQGKGNER